MGYSNASSVLPMTGDNLLLYVIVGVAIIAAGFAMRAVSKRA